MNQAAISLRCTDFGMRLAKRQVPNGVGRTSVAMSNARTLGSAFQYSAEHMYTYGTAVRLSSVELPKRDRWLIDFEILARGIPDSRQALEHAIAGAALKALSLSEGKAVVKEIWLRHDPVSPLATYRAHSPAPVASRRPAIGSCSMPSRRPSR